MAKKWTEPRCGTIAIGKKNAFGHDISNSTSRDVLRNSALSDLSYARSWEDRKRALIICLALSFFEDRISRKDCIKLFCQIQETTAL
ncbi:MAG: hypothetical protein Q8N55_00970 [bacterium]|nr:hypothetical protein [bacterium]